MDEVRSQHPWRIACGIFAKLLSVVLTYWLVEATAWTMPHRSIRKVVQGIQSYTLALALTDLVRLLAVVCVLHRSLQSGNRHNPRKRHLATYQLLLPLHLGYLS